MNQVISAVATSGPGGLVGAGFGWFAFDAFAAKPACGTFPCPTVEPTLMGMDFLSFVVLLAAVGAAIGWFVGWVKPATP